MPENEKSQTNGKSEGGWFKMSNAIFDLDLNPNEIAVYAVLSRRADKHGLCYPSLTRIGSDTGIRSENTVRKTLKSLTGKNLIRKTSRTVKGVAIFEVLTPSKFAGVTPPEFESTPPHEMSTKEDPRKKTHLFLNREKKPEQSSGEKSLNNGGGNCNSGDRGEAQKPNQNTLSSDEDQKPSPGEKDYAGEVEIPPSQEVSPVPNSTLGGENKQNLNGVMDLKLWPEVLNYLYTLTDRERDRFDRRVLSLWGGEGKPGPVEKRKLAICQYIAERTAPISGNDSTPR